MKPQQSKTFRERKPLGNNLSNATKLIEQVVTYCTSHDVDAYLVGGYVRDKLIGRIPKDIDIAVDSDVAEFGLSLAQFLGGTYVPVDLPRHIVRVAVDRGGIEPEVIDVAGLPNGLEADLRRRDFTIGSMAFPVSRYASDLNADDIIDPVGGLDDFRAKLIRHVSDSVFVEDPGRLMRAPRLAVELGFRVHDDTLAKIREDSVLVSRVSAERVRDEFLKLLALPGATKSIEFLDELGLLSKVIPEIDQSRGVTQPSEHYYDVFGHLIRTPGMLEMVFSDSDEDFMVRDTVPYFDMMNEYFAAHLPGGYSRLAILKLTALLHDIAKPATRSVEDTGRIRFLGHDIEGAETVSKIAARLRLSRVASDNMRTMVRYHLRPGQMAPKGELPSGKAIFRYYRDAGDVAIDTLYLNLADYLAAVGPRLEKVGWSQRCKVVGHILDQGFNEKSPNSIPSLVTGHDIMESLRVPPGAIVGEMLTLVQEAQAADEIKTKDEALQFVRSHFETGGTCA